LLTNVSNAYGTEQGRVSDLYRPVYVIDANGVTVTNTYERWAASSRAATRMAGSSSSVTRPEA
jgi:hypothetical protein